jgi:phospholipid transport system substrate-binding protein
MALNRRRTLLCVPALVFACALPARAQKSAEADPAVTPVRAFYDTLLAVMKQATALGVQGRYDKLAPAIRSAFDLSAMTRIAVGPEWTTIAPEQQTALVDAFTRMTIATYANRFNGYSGETFVVDPEVLARSTGRIVRTQLIRSKDEPVSLNYLMRASGDSWKIVDVYLNGTISQLATQRSDFSGILKSGGPTALIESLRQQAERMLHPT